MLPRMVEIERQRLTHRYDLSVLLKTLVQSLLEGVYDHPHPLGRDYVRSSDKQMGFRANGPNEELARVLQKKPWWRCGLTGKERFVLPQVVRDGLCNVAVTNARKAANNASGSTEKRR